MTHDIEPSLTPLALDSCSEQITTFWVQMFTAIVLLGLWHGLFALPVILSLVGTASYHNAPGTERGENGALVAPGDSTGDASTGAREAAKNEKRVPGEGSENGPPGERNEKGAAGERNGNGTPGDKNGNGAPGVRTENGAPGGKHENGVMIGPGKHGLNTVNVTADYVTLGAKKTGPDDRAGNGFLKPPRRLAGNGHSKLPGNSEDTKSSIGSEG